MWTSKTFFKSKYIVFGPTIKNFSSIRAVQQPSTSANISNLELGAGNWKCWLVYWGVAILRLS